MARTRGSFLENAAQLALCMTNLLWLKDVRGTFPVSSDTPVRYVDARLARFDQHFRAGVPLEEVAAQREFAAVASEGVVKMLFPPPQAAWMDAPDDDILAEAAVLSQALPNVKLLIKELERLDEEDEAQAQEDAAEEAEELAKIDAQVAAG